jgi:hypothetical protein
MDTITYNNTNGDFLIVLFFYLGWMFNSKLAKKALLSAEERAKIIIAGCTERS